jgi:RNA polymerase sigma factor (sigma-70 family)
MAEKDLTLSPSRPRLAMPGIASDARLARRAANGDRRAFAEIFERHHQAIYRYCRSILRHDEDAADALQNTMAAALRGLEGETREIALRPWLFRIAHNESLSLVRQRRAHGPVDDMDVPGSPGLEAEALASERMRELVEDVRALPDRQRGALVMRELSGLQYREIAAVFGVAEGAARQAVYEAREMLHESREGRAMSCADIRTRISARDGRLLRGRKVRAHLRACAGCREFRAMIPARRAGLAALAPPLAAPLAASMLDGLLGGGGSGGAGPTASGALARTASTTKANSVGGFTLTTNAALAAKAAMVLAAGAALTGGAILAEDRLRSNRGRAALSPRPADTPGPRSAQRPSERAQVSAQSPRDRANASDPVPNVSTSPSSPNEDPPPAGDRPPAGQAPAGRTPGAHRPADPVAADTAPADQILADRRPASPTHESPTTPTVPAAPDPTAPAPPVDPPVSDGQDTGQQGPATQATDPPASPDQ